MTSHQPHLSHPKYRPDIDGLRAIAVLAVVIFHAFPSMLKGGFIGVDIFFVISGYLISTIIFENLDKGTFSFFEFYARRVKRIFPALLLVLVACFAFGWYALLADEYAQLGKHVAGGTGFVSNIIFWNEAGYFDNSAETKPLLHLWSLGIEEQFYIIWPFLLWFAWRRKFNLLIITVLVAAASFALNVNGIKESAIATFYSPQTRFWELLAGSLLSYLVLYKHVIPAKFSHIQSNAISVTGFLLLAFSAFFVNKADAFPGWWAPFPVIGAVLVILAGNKAFINGKILSSKIPVWFGLISFPLYLWHWPLLSFARLVEGQTPVRTSRIIAVLTAIVLAWLTYRFIEKYIRFSKGYTVVISLVTGSLVLALAGMYVFLHAGLSERSAVKNSGFTEEVRKQFAGPMWAYTKNDACLKEYPYKDAANLDWWFCMKNGNASPTIVILGSSYANQLYPGFIYNKKLKNHTVLSIGTCDFAGGISYEGDKRSPCHGQRITEQAAFIDDVVTSQKSIKFAIIDGLSRNPDSAYIERLRTRIGLYESKGIRVILFTPHIIPPFHPKACFTTPLRPVPKDCSFPLSERQNLYENFKPVVEALKKTNPNVLIFEQNQEFCQGEKCSYVRNGMPMHRDDTHTSEYASIELQSYFNEWARSNVPEIFDVGVVYR